MHLLHRIQELVDQGKENESITSQPVNKKVAVSQKLAIQKQNKVKSAKKKTVFSHPQLVPRSVRARRGRGRVTQPRFAQQTLSSQRRQQPQQTVVPSPLKHSMPALLHSSTPFTVQSEDQKQRQHRPVLQSAKNQQMEPPQSRDHTSPQPDTPLCNMVRKNTLKETRATKATPCPAPTNASSSQTNRQRGCTSAPSLVIEDKKAPKIALNLPVNGQGVPDDAVSSPATIDEQKLWMESISATLAHHSQQLETFKKSTQKQLGHLQQSLSSQRKTRKKTEEDVAASPAEHGDDENQQCEEEESGSFDGRKLEGLMERLRELEGEEEVIRERWRTIAYEDPLLARPPILHCTEEQPSSKNGKKLEHA